MVVTETKEQVQKVTAHLNRALEKIGCSRRLKEEVFAKDWKDFTEDDFAKIMSSGYQIESFRRAQGSEKDGFQTLYFMNLNRTEEQLITIVKEMFQDKSCGNIFRVKGFMKNISGGWMELNATVQKMTVRPIQEGQEVLIVIGEALEENKIRERLEGKIAVKE